MNNKSYMFLLAVVLAAVLLGCKGTPAPSALDELDIAIRDASNYLNNNIPRGSMVVILNIQSSSSDLSNYIIEELVANAINDNAFTVTERQQLDLIRAEQNFQLSGDVDDNTALAIGRFLGARTIVSGSIRVLGSGHRMSISALDVQTARVQGQYNRNITSSAMIANLTINTTAAATTTSEPVSFAPVVNVSSLSSMRQPAVRPAASIPKNTLLHFGAMSYGAVDLGEEYWYSVQTLNNGFVIIETFGSTDTFLHAYNSALEELSTDDDSGDRFNARLELLVNANQTYYFKLRGVISHGSNPEGPYRIMARFLPDNTGRDYPNTSKSNSALLKINEAIPISFIQQDQCRWFFYEVTRYGTFTVFTEGTLDSYLTLYNRYGGIIARDDDSGEGRNAKISRNLSPGIYFIDVCERRGRLGGTTLHAEFK